ncbi:hypothetical protein CIB95_13695 [Lottiidibacillus patelloidae]|uniref:Uncharacterized protein n=2 Tax=Lottiidibacillus patelloidae TaxID=2670334 RepID=A0A263BR62_9BACI|nr:hypothetical protein CIB95_13695 [Lottiidibacillus patelloidae]
MGELSEKEMHDHCKKYQLYFVMMEMKDGKMQDGIIEKVDDKNVYMLVPVGDMPENRDDDDLDEDDDFDRTYGGYGGYGGYGYGGYGYPYRRRFRRFRRFRFPFFGIRRFFFPFFPFY